VHLVRQAAFLEHDRDLAAIRGFPGVEFDHCPSPNCVVTRWPLPAEWGASVPWTDRSVEVGLLKWLLALVVAIAVLTVVSPWLGRYGFGRLPGDITVRVRGRDYYFPFTTTILLSLALTLIAKFF
jgi:hypothetical protein